MSDWPEATADAGGNRQRRRDFGARLLGPVIAEYLQKLHVCILEFEAERGAKPLFVSRAGVRIRHALDVFTTTAGLPTAETDDYFWISRFMVTKGTWARNRQNALALLEQEFAGYDLRDAADAVFRTDPEAALAELDEQEFRNAPSLRLFLAAGGPAAQAIEAHFKQQSELFERYLQQLLQDRQRALLIDTGWAGTSQRLLADAFPDIDWWGAYFGRYGFEHTDRRYWNQMIGLVFEEDRFLIGKPETCVVHHRHMIESLFEPVGKSIERLALDRSGKVVAPEARQLLLDDPNEIDDPLFCGVLLYLSSLPDGASPAALHKAARAAWRDIARIVALPSREDTELFGDIVRSADFGKTLHVPAVLPTEPRDAEDTPARRIRDALWPAGQVAAEYPPEIAEPLQRKLAGLGRNDFKTTQLVPVAVPRIRERPAVAVITRTLDRPMFLKRALESVAAQTFDDYIHVVVNDGGDADVARRTIERTNCAQHKIMLVDNVVNRGMEAASNIGIAAADSDYIVIHDDDDSWEPAYLEKTVAFLDGPKGSVYGGVITQTTYVSEEVTPDGIVICDRAPYQAWVQSVHIMEMAMGNFFAPIAFLYRRDICEKIGGYNEDYPVLGDWDFNLRFLLESDIGMVHEPLANYHHRDRGDTELFGNSVIAGRDKHMEYAAVVRNRLARHMLHAEHPALAVLVGMGEQFDANRRAIRDIHARTEALSPTAGKQSGSAAPSSEAVRAEMADEYWVAVNRLGQAVARQDKKVLEAIRRRFADLAGKGGRNGTAPVSGRSAGWLAMQELKELGGGADPLEPPPDFDEEAYLQANGDVAEAVYAGSFGSGYQHYYKHGRREGRARPTKEEFSSNV